MNKFNQGKCLLKVLRKWKVERVQEMEDICVGPMNETKEEEEEEEEDEDEQ